MSIIELTRKANQRQLLLNRRSVHVLTTRGGRVFNGRIDVTRSSVGMLKKANHDLLTANQILRRHTRHA